MQAETRQISRSNRPFFIMIRHRVEQQEALMAAFFSTPLRSSVILNCRLKYRSDERERKGERRRSFFFISFFLSLFHLTFFIIETTTSGVYQKWRRSKWSSANRHVAGGREGGGRSRKETRGMRVNAHLRGCKNGEGKRRARTNANGNVQPRTRHAVLCLMYVRF